MGRGGRARRQRPLSGERPHQRGPAPQGPEARDQVQAGPAGGDRMTKALTRLAAALLLALAAMQPAAALDKVSIVVFGPPSLGAFLPPVIKKLKLDEQNGLAIDFQ